jgi:hypothetical protein
LSYQILFASELNLPEASARNQALRENAFMGIVCLQLSIPVFFIGKPGSSKTLAKTAIENTLTSTNRCLLFEHLKPVTMLTFQCAPHTTSEDILLTFRKAERLPGRAIRAVCLDEVGLAEDSKHLPLKVLHQLLDDSVKRRQASQIDVDGVLPPISMLGISNWALDPAKLNRGLWILRDSPDTEELIVSATGILNSHHGDQHVIQLLRPLAEVYQELYNQQGTAEGGGTAVEMFGLRDFYSLIKLISCHTSVQKLRRRDLEMCIRR